MSAILFDMSQHFQDVPHHWVWYLSVPKESVGSQVKYLCFCVYSETLNQTLTLTLIYKP